MLCKCEGQQLIHNKFVLQWEQSCTMCHGNSSQSTQEPYVSPKDTNTLITMAQMKSAETYPPKSSPFGLENDISINNNQINR